MKQHLFRDRTEEWALPPLNLPVYLLACVCARVCGGLCSGFLNIFFPFAYLREVLVFLRCCVYLNRIFYFIL